MTRSSFDTGFDTGLQSSSDGYRNGRDAMSDINTTPLVDVMLVLLVVFIITAPLFTRAISLDLPDVSAPAVTRDHEPITISIDEQGQVYWNDEKLDDVALLLRMKSASDASATPPDVQLRADQSVRYARVAFVMSAAQEAGLTRLAFVTDPTAPAIAAKPPIGPNPSAPAKVPRQTP